MKIVAISDLHGYLPKDLPEGDILCICGDICPLEIQRDFVSCVAWFGLNFNTWANSLPYKKVIFIAGNHDFFLESLHLGKDTITWRNPSSVMKKLLPLENKGKSKLIYLCDNSYEFGGIKFYGTPWVKDLSNWAFYKTNEELAQVYDQIPKNVDVLLTHMPCSLLGVGDVLQRNAFNYLSMYGSFELSEAILARNIKYALCGHVHSGAHQLAEYMGTKFANVSIKDEDYIVRYSPLEIEI